MLEIKLINKSVHAALFDLDDTLMNSEHIYAAIYQNLQLDMPVFKEARNVVKAQLGPGHVAARNRLLYFKKYLELKNQFSANSLLTLNCQYEEQLQKLIEQDLMRTNIPSILQRLSSKIPLGIVTNENLRTQMLKLQMLDPQQSIFKFIVTSEEVGAEKPDLSIIHHALQRLPFAPNSVVMIGDSINNDLISFQKVGCQVIGTRQFRDESTQPNPFPWIENLQELMDF